MKDYASYAERLKDINKAYETTASYNQNGEQQNKAIKTPKM